MINPQPVESQRSPYGTSSRSGLPRHIPASPLNNKPKRPLRARKVIFAGILCLVIASSTFAIATVNHLRAQVLVQHQGENSSVLGYQANDEFGKLDITKFQHAGDGRFNIAVVGVGGISDTGKVHDGTYLTDSIQVVSLDPVNHKIGVTGIPRDLYSPTYRSKINAVYTYAEQQKAGSGPLAIRQELGKILGISISNFALIDFTGFKDAIDSVGGVDLTTEAIYDPLFPCDDEIRYCTYSISAGVHHLDGNAALKYARSRETSSDFKRSARQQQLISALKKKVLSAGTLSNPAKITSLISVLGSHFKTDMSFSDLTTFLSLYKDIPAEATTTTVLDISPSQGLLTSTTDPIVGFIEYPLLGYSNYSDVQSFFQKNNPDPFIVKEAATITVAGTASSTKKQLDALVLTLKEYGYNAVISPTQYVGKATSTQLYMLKSDQKPFSRNYLQSQLGVTASTGNVLGSTSNFEIIYVPSTKR